MCCDVMKITLGRLCAAKVCEGVDVVKVTCGDMGWSRRQRARGESNAR
jgi:hypothetical protein